MDHHTTFQRTASVTGAVTYFCRAPSPVGEILLTATSRGLSGLHFREDRFRPEPESGWEATTVPFGGVIAALDAYFAGTRAAFDLPLDLAGTPFQLRVWAALQRIPYGETISYAELARRIGAPTAIRAVGGANGRNPVSIIVPCHRVIGADGSLTGYASGIGRKRKLLEHEARFRARYAVDAGVGAPPGQMTLGFA
jgi:methylated-DNA-[protein]-cysteine S-methyltransferase